MGGIIQQGVGGMEQKVEEGSAFYGCKLNPSRVGVFFASAIRLQLLEHERTPATLQGASRPSAWDWGCTIGFPLVLKLLDCMSQQLPSRQPI
jgi:hypothetical protein